MYPYTEKFARHLTGDHEVTTRIQALPSPDADPVDISRYFEGGSLTVAPQAIRRTGTITLVDSDGSLLPLLQSSLIAPYGQQLIIEHGLVFPDGSEELIPQGVFRITKPVTPSAVISLDLADRAWIVSGAYLEAPLTIAKGTPYTEAIRLLLVTAYPQIVIETVVSEDITPTIVLEDKADPWDEAKKMAAAIGYSLHFDRFGVCQLGPEPDLAGADAVWTYSDASDEFIPRDDRHWFNLATRIEISWDTDDAHNAVIVTGENTDNDTPFRGVAKDLDPTSPTFYGGEFGKRPRSVTDPLVTSNQMAERSASTALQNELGISEALTIEAIAHPALDIGDPILVNSQRHGINNQMHVTDGFNMPLRAGTQTVETRRRRVVLGV